MPVSRRIDRKEARANFRKEIFNMLTVWKTKQQALEILKNNDQKIDEWLDPKGHPIVTSAVGARILIVKETGKAPAPTEVRNV